MKHINKKLAALPATRALFMQNNLITIEELTQLFKVNRVTIWRWTKAGKLSKSKYKNLVFYNRAEVLNYLESIRAMVERVTK